MKKLILTLVIVLGMGTMTFAQFSEEVYEEAGLFGKGGIFRGGTGEDPLLLPDHGKTDDQDADSPLGTGIAMLTTLGAEYAFAKKRKED